jgi:hypothetical protein
LARKTARGRVWYIPVVPISIEKCSGAIQQHFYDNRDADCYTSKAYAAASSLMQRPCRPTHLKTKAPEFSVTRSFYPNTVPAQITSTQQLLNQKCATRLKLYNGILVKPFVGKRCALHQLYVTRN